MGLHERTSHIKEKQRNRQVNTEKDTKIDREG